MNLSREQWVAIGVVGFALLCYGGRFLPAASGGSATTTTHRIVPKGAEIDVRPATAATAAIRPDYAEPVAGGAPFVLRPSAATLTLRLPPPPPFALPLPPPLPLPQPER